MRFRPTLKQKMRQNALSMRAQADPGHRQALLADPNVHERVKQSIRSQIAWEEEALAYQPKRRAPRLDAPHKPLERDILKAIVQALRLHPRVIKVVRFNSGGSMYRAPDGREHLVLFSSEPVPDLFVLLQGGFCWLEVKRPGWEKPRDMREQRQADFLATARQAGGIGAFVRSVDEALAVIG